MRRIIHWGTPADIESYIQETGRAGRDGSAKLIMLQLIFTNCTYCLNKEICRLLRDFDTLDTIVSPLHLCTRCDISAECCKCDKCSFLFNQ